MEASIDESILIDAALPNAPEKWLRSRDLGKTVCFFNIKSSQLWEEIKATHRHREMGDNMGMVPLKTVRLSDQSDWINDIIERVQPYTLTRPERIAALCSAVEYVVRCRIPGSIVECGVWRGGSMMASALTLQCFEKYRGLWLFDTFEGMSAPTDVDRSAHTGEKADDIMSRVNQGSTVWCRASLEDVERNMISTKYPRHLMNFVKGKVEDTVNDKIGVNQIAVLRLDTDWYESTKHELDHLYPLLATGGVLIIDDYGHWEGAKKAVDEWVKNTNPKILLNRVDYSCRIGVKL